MFELSVAKKYLTPRFRQLSVSIISLISILVISLVVWLIVVFFSVTNGLEKGWIEKLIALTAPIRVTPTEKYYDSYYYQIDGISANSDYATKSLSEKLKSENTNPYDASFDETPPAHFRAPHLNADGSLKDIVKEAYRQIEKLNHNPKISEVITAKDYEVTMSHLKIKLLRNFGEVATESTINQPTYLGSLNLENPSLKKTLLPLSNADLNNAFFLTSQGDFQAKLKTFLNDVTIENLEPRFPQWNIPKSVWPKSATLQALKVTQNSPKIELIVTENEKTLLNLKAQYQEMGIVSEIEEIKIKDGQIFIKNYAPKNAVLKLSGKVSLPAKLVEGSIAKAKQADDLRFDISFTLQNTVFSGKTFFKGLKISKTAAPVKSIFFEESEGILLPKTFRDAGVLVGDLSHISYYSPTMSAMQEQQIPVFVAGFYDHGLIPIGGKFILAKKKIVNQIRTSQANEQPGSNGINISFENLDKANLIKSKIEKGFKEAGIDKYFKVETYKEYDFTKDILQQLQSDKTLFSLISTIIIIVACSNIISMLIIMVNDKKTEIGILRSMGTSSFSIAFIFGTCGIVMGVMGSVIGTIAAYFTLQNMNVLIYFLSELQGHNAFNPMFYGDVLPNEISFEAMLFVIVSTALISLIAGIVPAVKACSLRPSAILRAE